MSTRPVSNIRHRIRNVGKSLDFNGSTSYCTIPDLVLSASGFNIAFRFMVRSVTNNGIFISTTTGAYLSGLTGLQIKQSTSGNGFVIHASSWNNDGLPLNAVGTKVLKLNTWYHFILSYSPNNYKSYIDCVLEGSDTSGTFPIQTQEVYIGREANSAASYSNILMSELVIHNRDTVWTEEEREKVCFKGIFPEGASYYTFNDSLVDLSEVGYDISGNNVSYNNSIYITTRTASLRRFTPNLSVKAVSFNAPAIAGSARYPELPSPNGFSFALWTKVMNETSLGQLISYVTSSSTHGFVIFPTTNSRLAVSMYNSGAVADFTTPTNSFPRFKWNHIAFTYTPNNLKVYIDTILRGSDTSCIMGVPDAQFLTLGQKSSGGGTIHCRETFFVFQNTEIPWTEAQIKDLYFDHKIPEGASWYDFMDDMVDQSRNGNDLTVVSTPQYLNDIPGGFGVRSAI